MNVLLSQPGSVQKRASVTGRVYRFLARRAASVILFAALACTLLAKFYHALRQDLLSSYPGWVLSDIAFLLALEALLAIVCCRWPKRWLLRSAIVSAAILCTWSVMNAGWLVRTGTQILPTVLLPLVRDPLNSLIIIGVNLAKMPLAAVAILGPSAVALAFFFAVVTRPSPLGCARRPLVVKTLLSGVIILSTFVARPLLAVNGSSQVAFEEMRYNSQLRAITRIAACRSTLPNGTDHAEALRKIPSCDDLFLPASEPNQLPRYNLVIVVLEGVQYSYTSLSSSGNDLTPHLAVIARQGVEFSNARSTLTHTTKVLFALLTGRFPSVSQDLAEAVPVEKPYLSLATILKRQSGCRTAFFQSAKGSFESRPALVHNLGFEKFWAREDLNNTDAFVGSLGSDEFAMLKPIADWIKTDHSPFFLTILCSVTHDPYEVPHWFAEPAQAAEDCYRQTISYTDAFLAALDTELSNLGLADSTILCIVGDHGEAFGEHGLLSHERIAFDEALRIPFCIRAPSLVSPGARVTAPVSSIDLTPTILALLGFDPSPGNFDGRNALAQLPPERKLYFAGWLEESPAGFIKGSQKYIYYPSAKICWRYDLDTDALEQTGTEVAEPQAVILAEEIRNWRNSSIFFLDQSSQGEMTLFQSWLCRWEQRIPKKCSRL